MPDKEDADQKSPLLGGDLEGDGAIVTFQTYYDPMLAHIVRARLEDNGISCFIADENINIINPLYNNALGGIKLKIFARDEERCKAILAEDEALALPDDAAIDAEADAVTVCPECGSTNVRYGAATKNKYGWPSFLVSLFTFTQPLTARKAWHCFNCGADFDPLTP